MPNVKTTTADKAAKTAIAAKAKADKAAKAKNAVLKAARLAKPAATPSPATAIVKAALAAGPDASGAVVGSTVAKPADTTQAAPADTPPVPRELLLDSTYTGASLPVHIGRKQRSYTELPKRVMQNYTARTDSFMRDGLAKFGIAPFADTGGDKSVREQLAYFGMLEKRDAGTIQFTAFAKAYAADQKQLPKAGQTTADGVFSAAKRLDAATA